MNWEAIGAVGEILGAIAVVVSLVYLATQIRQNSKAVRNEALQRAIEDRSSMAKITMQSDLAPIWRRGLGEFDSLTDDEKVQFNGVMLTMISSHMGLRGLFLDGSLDRSTFTIFEDDLTGVMLCPGVRTWWNETQSAYITWADYVNGLISRGEGRKIPYTESWPFLKPGTISRQ